MVLKLHSVGNINEHLEKNILIIITGHYFQNL